ncbi:MAG: DUF4143 domain-containing protein [Bacteroidia bacterium]
MEWKNHSGENDFEIGLKVENWLLFGLYPEVLLIENHGERRSWLQELTSAYLYKDILALANIQYPEKLRQLLKLLAFQVGNLVSIHEIASLLQINRDTVIHYIDLLEKAFVIFRLGGFSRKLRKEVTKMEKIYFYDMGIRNALIENFSPLALRNDTGALWENFLLSERRKKREYQAIYANTYFWRTHSGAEIDYVEERDGQLAGYEFKWKTGKARTPATWLETYENASWSLINRDNFCDFIC